MELVSYNILTKEKTPIKQKIVRLYFSKDPMDYIEVYAGKRFDPNEAGITVRTSHYRLKIIPDCSNVVFITKDKR